MSQPCKNCGQPNFYGTKYDGFCLNCINAGIDDLAAELQDMASALENGDLLGLSLDSVPPGKFEAALDRENSNHRFARILKLLRIAKP